MKRYSYLISMVMMMAIYAAKAQALPQGVVSQPMYFRECGNWLKDELKIKTTCLKTAAGFERFLLLKQNPTDCLKNSCEAQLYYHDKHAVLHRRNEKLKVKCTKEQAKEIIATCYPDIDNFIFNRQNINGRNIYTAYLGYNAYWVIEDKNKCLQESGCKVKLYREKAGKMEYDEEGVHLYCTQETDMTLNCKAK